MKYVKPEMEVIKIEMREVFTQISTIPGVSDGDIPGVNVPEEPF